MHDPASLRSIVAMPDEINIGNERRPLNESAVEILMEFIAQIGQQTPVAVLERAGAYDLVAGMHRVEACRRMEALIWCYVFSDEDTARQWVIDENLARADLTTAERQQARAARSELIIEMKANTKSL